MLHFYFGKIKKQHSVIISNTYAAFIIKITVETLKKKNIYYKIEKIPILNIPVVDCKAVANSKKNIYIF